MPAPYHAREADVRVHVDTVTVAIMETAVLPCRVNWRNETRQLPRCVSQYAPVRTRKSTPRVHRPM